jgi:hypothetical protein
MAIAILGATSLHAALAVICAERDLPTVLCWRGKAPADGRDDAEPELVERFEQVRASGRLRVASAQDAPIRDAWVVVLCGEPTLAPDETRYRELEDLAASVAPALRPGVLVCVEAHLAPGDVRERIAPHLARGSGLRLGETLLIAFSPPRATRGHAFSDASRLPQILGAWNAASLARATEFYLRIADSVLVPTTSLEAAELISLVDRAHREVASAFVHEISRLARSCALDAEEVLGFSALSPYFPLHRPGLAHLGDDVELAASLLARASSSPLLALAGELQERTLMDGVRRLEEVLGGLAGRAIELWIDGAHGAAAPAQRIERLAAALTARGAELTRRELAPHATVCALPASPASAIVVATDRLAWPRVEVSSFPRCIALLDASSALRRRAVESAGWRYLAF